MLGTQLSVAMDICKEDGTDKRDPCSSPPCKRLKQACIHFETVSNDKEISMQPNGLLSNKEIPTNPQLLPTNQHHVHKHEQCDITDHNLPIQFKDFFPSDDTSNNSGSNLPKSPNHAEKPLNNSSPLAVNNGSILKFTQPVTCCPPDVDDSKTPSKDYKNSPAAPSTPNHAVSPVTPVLSDQIVSPVLPPTPINTPKLNTQKNRTPRRKLSVAERLHQEEEKLKKQKERENLECERLEKKREKEKIKEEKEKERQEAKEKKEQERLDQVVQKKLREKERQEKKEQDEKEKKERLGKKEEERKKREEEKKTKDNEKNSKNEEKCKKEEEQMMKKQKIKNHFANFFIKKEVTSPKQKEQVKTEIKFQPFEIKPGMKLANTICRKPLSEEAKEVVNKILIEQVTTSISQVKEELQELKSKLACERHMHEESTRNIANMDEDDDDVILIEKDSPDGATTILLKEENSCTNTKLLQFHDNYRPAYFGTWRKKSSHVGPRAPFKKDMDLINYEVDSDEEWEEKEPGESLSNSEGEDEENDGNNEEENEGENDGFFVPHGYLSDDEGIEENETEEDTTDGEKLPEHKVEDRMQRQLAKQKVWETEMKRQFKPIKSVAIGCVWSGEIPSVLKQLEACCLVESQSIYPCPQFKDNKVSNSYISNSYISNTAARVPEEAMPALITLVHCNTTGLHKLIQMFRKEWTMQAKKEETVLESNWENHCQISKRQLERKITTIAKKERRSIMPKARWYVHDSILAQYKMENILPPKNGYISCHIEQTSLGTSTPSIKHFTQIANSSPSRHNGINLQVQSVDTLEEHLMDTSPV